MIPIIFLLAYKNAIVLIHLITKETLFYYCVLVFFDTSLTTKTIKKVMLLLTC